ncbi:aminodeoxychorismate synthase component I [Paraferrimonas haliotis]|nr:aminodeoxychorismate synthase component I [Paraferrimonas haliotis]
MAKQLYSLTLDWSWPLCQHFSALAQLPWAMLLDSSDADHVDARFDIAVAQPLATLTSKQGETRVSYAEELGAGFNAYVSSDAFHRKTSPFELVKRVSGELLGEQPLASDLGDHWPFIGGALGYFSYDLGRYSEHLPSQAANDIDAYDMAVGIFDWALIADKHNRSINLVHFGDEAGLAKRLAWLEARIADYQQAPKAPQFQNTGPWRCQQSQQGYVQAFEQVQAYLHSGDCYQINLTQRFDMGYAGDEYQAYLKLREHNQAPFAGFMRLDDHAILSLSPERFIQCQDQQLQTKPIKGTKARHAEPDKDQQAAQALQASEKDRAENLMIVDLLRNDFGRVAKPGSVTVPSLFAIESFPAVHHLVSTINAELDEQYSAIDALAAAFPGGSITGAPKIRAMEIIEELELSRRSIYCGSLGYISHHGHMDSNICIRTLLAKNNTLYCWAGGGIVADSQLELEYQECFDKVSKILPLLGMPPN